MTDRQKTRAGSAASQGLTENVASGSSLMAAVVEEMTSGPTVKTKPMTRPHAVDKIRKDSILLVEDSPVMASFYRQMLGNYYSVETTNEDQSAVSNAAQDPPRLILIDDAGDGSKAVGIVRQLREENSTRDIPVLMMLPIDTFGEFRTMICPYVDMCIPKTFTPAVLIPSLQSLLSS